MDYGQFKPAPGIPECEVSDLGFIKRLSDGYISRGGKDGRYLCLPFEKLRAIYGKVYIHRLVCKAFNGPPPSNKKCVNHIDGDKTNNHYSNLEWSNHSENGIHAYKTKLNSKTGKPVLIWDVLVDKITKYNSLPEAISIVEDFDSNIANNLRHTKFALYRNRYKVKRADDPTPWPNKQELRRMWLMFEKEGTGMNYPVLSYVDAGRILSMHSSFFSRWDGEPFTKNGYTVRRYNDVIA